MNDRRQLAERQLLEIELLAGVINVDTNQVSHGIVVEHDAFRDLDALAARLFGQIDI